MNNAFKIPISYSTFSNLVASNAHAHLFISKYFDESVRHFGLGATNRQQLIKSLIKSLLNDGIAVRKSLKQSETFAKY